MREAADSDRTSHLLPAQAIDQCCKHLLKGDAVQRITGLGLAHFGGGRVRGRPAPLHCNRRARCRRRADQGDRLRLTFLRELLQQLLSQSLGRRRANLSALAALARGDGEDLAGDPVVAFVRLAIDLAGHGVARWGLLHRCINDWRRDSLTCTTRNAGRFGVSVMAFWFGLIRELQNKDVLLASLRLAK